MNISDILTPERIACAATPASKKKALEEISAIIAVDDSNLSSTDIFDSLLARERLGSTGIGHGVAIPHGRVASAKQTTAAFLQLKEGIDFDAIDGQPVRLLFAMLVPEESTDDHLKILAQLAEMFNNQAFCTQVLQASSPEQVHDLLTSWKPDAA